mgnify:CR=1 FL=1
MGTTPTLVDIVLPLPSLPVVCRRKPLDAVLRPGPARSSMSGAKTLEEVIRWA